MVETVGKRVGVINGLSVLNTGEYSFGRPSRITVTTSLGNKGIVNIEREVDMSGPIHNKGVLILSGYLYENLVDGFWYYGELTEPKNNISGIHGYWTLSSYAGNSNLAWHVGCAGQVQSIYVDRDFAFGVRPIISVYKFQME